MDIIIHRIRLRDGVDRATFESWVRETDYATCPLLPSVVSFDVQRVEAETAAPFHYFEVISVSSREDFRRDMEGDTFQGLAAEFEKLATVVDELAGERLEPGYRAA
ncbi:RedY protein [Streptomyces sp. 891-h]|uniref:RedY protein n=1 Tax=unclassified Streptomyces TaxID=2593676 RepID=UPI001FA95522|nr:RedY protein [Streptomyces sp. 891-h]UNZ20706.1 RedY protein [Streptomyces sp. 891-h]